MNISRHTVVVLVGAILFAITWWLSRVWVASLGIKFGHLEVVGFVPAWLDAFHRLVPGVVVGMISASYAIRSAVAAVILGSLVVNAYLVSIGFSHSALSLVNATCLDLAYASIAAFAGSFLRKAWSN